MPAFVHHELSLINPAFDSPLVDILTELEHLRRLRLSGTTPAPLFFQLKQIFHMLESLGSARIEGNHTTLADLVESRLEGEPSDATDQLREMENIERAMSYIDEHVQPGSVLTEMFIRELHALTVANLKREGDSTPGTYRQVPVSIAGASHLPPDAFLVSNYMAELVDFINRGDQPKYDLIKVALAHHRFGWIHPFRNGNGRVVRLLTYLLLIKYGFNVQTGGRVLNPTAVFCNDRDQYYRMLAQADSGTAGGMESWCVYVLQGILDELRKVDRLADFSYLQENILIPALSSAEERQVITRQEAMVLQRAAKSGIAKTGDLTGTLTDLSSGQRTYLIKKLVERKMLQPIKEGARQYAIGFSNSVLMRGIIMALSNEGFIPASLNRPVQRSGEFDA
ncbi:MAG: Fic family protein [Chlorobiaceae bacterium]|nr:Fic family protein [Chlorobiaceae bacterium]